MWIKDLRSWLWLLLLGSSWGLLEVLAGGSLYENDVPHASVWLTAGGLFLVAVGRGGLNKPGSSTVVALFAAAYKLANAAPFYCHLLGIFMLGLAFDVFASWLLAEKRGGAFWRAPLAGVLGAYAGNAAFAALMTFILQYTYWVEDGLRKFVNHVLVNGSLVSLLALVLVPLGFTIGKGSETLSLRRPRFATAGATVLIATAWAAGRLLG